MIRIMNDVNVRKDLAHGPHIGRRQSHGHGQGLGFPAFELPRETDQGRGVLAWMTSKKMLDRNHT